MDTFKGFTLTLNECNYFLKKNSKNFIIFDSFIDKYYTNYWFIFSSFFVKKFFGTWDLWTYLLTGAARRT
jgi:hypothetical protein